MVVEHIFVKELRARIKAAYEVSGNALGWRFLASPEDTLRTAEVAFLGLNPGGREAPQEHPTFCVAQGSAYSDEIWAGYPVGQHPLQKQVLALFQTLDVEPNRVLAGNLVPFRSPNWKSLKNRNEALRFGKALWVDVFERVRPKLVIGMGAEANRALCDLLKVRDLKSVQVNWGRVSARKGEFHDGGRFVGLPHLSRFQIMTREASARAIRDLFGATAT